MLNTGLLMRKPGESGYGRYRRFLIANYSTHLKIKPKKKKASSWGVKDSKYRIAKFSTHIENRFIKNNRLNKYHKTLPIKRHYRPLKCCSTCLKIGFHSYVFDYEWLYHCPIHKTKLIDSCPECSHPWPTYSELINRKCSTCGYNINFKKLTQGINQPSDPYEVFKLIEDIVENRSKDILSETIIGVPNSNIAYYAEREFKQCINSNSILLFSVLNKLNAFSDDELNTLKSVDDIKFVEMSSISSSIQRIEHSSLYQLDHSDLIQKRSTIENQIESKLLSRIKQKPLSHKICSCVNDNGVCSSCLTWVVYILILSKNQSLADLKKPFALELTQILYSHTNSYTIRNILGNDAIEDLIIIDDHTENKSCYIKIPDDISLLIYKAELINLVSIINSFIKDFEFEEIVSWNKITKLVLEKIAKLSSGNYPLALSLKGDVLTALVPSKYLSDLHYI